MSNSGTEQNVLFYFNSVITIVIVVLVVILILTEKSRAPERRVHVLFVLFCHIPTHVASVSNI